MKYVFMTCTPDFEHLYFGMKKKKIPSILNTQETWSIKTSIFKNKKQPGNRVPLEKRKDNEII